MIATDTKPALLSGPGKSKGAPEQVGSPSPESATPKPAAVSKPKPVEAPKPPRARIAAAAKFPPIAEDPFEGIDTLTDAEFLGQQRQLLKTERATYEHQAMMLRAEADQLAIDMEPGDVQFDDESGEGASTSIERERDLAMAAQNAMYVEEIDRAIARIDAMDYGYCEACDKQIVRARLRAVPFTTLCVSCKSGGLSRR